MGTIFVDNLEPQSGTSLTLGANGDTISLASGASQTLAVNTPAFRAYSGNAQTISDNTPTRVAMNNEDFDTDGCYDHTTNYRFTPNVAGKYFVFAQVNCNHSSTGNDIEFAVAFIEKNGSEIVRNNVDPNNSAKSNQTYNYLATIVDMNGSSDYLDVFAQINVGSGSPSISASTQGTYFGAYRLVGA